MTNNSEKGLGRSISVGAIWMLGVRMSVKGLGLVSSIILARLLMPEDFGIVALAMAVYAFIRLIREFGFGYALIQNQDATRLHYDTAWTFQFILSLAATLVLVVAAPFAASFYEDPRLEPVFMVLALMFFVTGLENIGTIDFQKNMTFDKVFYVQVIPKFVSFVGTVSLAFYLRNYWALVYGMLINKILSLVMGYAMQSYRPRFRIEVWRQLFGFSSWLMINNFIKYLNRHGQNILLAKIGGAPLVGLITVATEFAGIIANEVIQPINTAAYPGYAKVSNAKEKLRSTFASVIEVTGIVALPGAMGIAALAPLFVPVLLGDKWLQAVPLIPYIAIASIFMSFMTAYDMLFMSLARQSITTALVALRVVIFFPLMYVLLNAYGATGVAIALLISNVAVFPLYQLAVRACIEISLGDLFAMMLRPILASLLMYVVVQKYVEVLGPMRLDMAGVGGLLSAVALGALAFCTATLLLWKLSGSPVAVEGRLLGIIKRRLAGAG